MRRTILTEILRDSDIARAIQPVVDQRHLTVAETRDALLALRIPRAAQVADLTTAI